MYTKKVDGFLKGGKVRSLPPQKYTNTPLHTSLMKPQWHNMHTLTSQGNQTICVQTVIPATTDS